MFKFPVQGVLTVFCWYVPVKNETKRKCCFLKWHICVVTNWQSVTSDCTCCSFLIACLCKTFVCLFTILQLTTPKHEKDQLNSSCWRRHLKNISLLSRKWNKNWDDQIYMHCFVSHLLIFMLHRRSEISKKGARYLNYYFVICDFRQNTDIICFCFRSPKKKAALVTLQTQFCL